MQTICARMASTKWAASCTLLARFPTNSFFWSFRVQPSGNPAIKTSVSSAVKKAGLISFVFVMYSYCTGGPFGLEDMVTTSGPGMSLIFLIVVPFFWCIPMSLVAAELTTAMPVEGGFYRWTRAAYGDFWGFLAGWWNWCSSF
jgi:amino acid transporter